MSKHRCAAIIIVLFIFILIFACGAKLRFLCKFGRRSEWAESLSNEHDDLKHLGEKLIAPYQFPVALSQDEKLLLTKGKTAKAFTLGVYKEGSLLARLNLETNPWEIAWNPAGTAVSFLTETDKPGTYAPYIWWITASHATPLKGPKTGRASFPFRWSPDGNHLSYIAYRGGESKLVLIGLRENNSDVEGVVDEIIPEGGMAWAPDSEAVAFAQASEGGGTSIKSLNVKTHRVDDLSPMPDGTIRDISWSPSVNSIAMTFRGVEDSHYRLVVLTLKKTISFCNVDAGDVESPVWSSPDRNIEYILDRNTYQTLRITHDCNKSSELFHPRSGSGRLQIDGYSRKAVPFIQSGSNGPPNLVSPQNGSSKSALNVKTATTTEPAGTQLWIPGSNYPVGGWLWKGNAEEKKDWAIVMVHGGPRLHETGEWEPLRNAFRKSGYTVLVPNYGGSTGYSREYEEILDLDSQANDVVNAIRYLTAPKGLNFGHTIIIASSYGTKIVLKALRKDPELCNIVVFSPFLAGRDDIQPDGPIPFKGKVLAFHGMRDPISSPVTALSLLNEVFSHAVSEDKFYWRQFEDEGHGFSRISSLQEEYGTILCASEATACPKNVTPKQ